MRTVIHTWRITSRNEVASPAWWCAAKTNSVVNSAATMTTASPANNSKVMSANGFCRTWAILSYATLPRPVSTRTSEYIICNNGTATNTSASCMAATVRT